MTAVGGDACLTINLGRVQCEWVRYRGEALGQDSRRATFVAG